MPLDPTATIVRDVRRAVVNALTGLRPSGRDVTESELSTTNIGYGRRLVEFAQQAAATLEEGGEAYNGLPCSAATFTIKTQRVQDLGALRETLASACERVNAEWNAARVDLGNDVTRVFTATEAIKAHPGVTPEVKAKVSAGSAPLYALREERKADRVAAAASTRSTNLRIATHAAESSAENASLKDEVASLRRENKFLSRGALQPEDLGAEATPGAGRPAPAELRSPAAPARARARRGPGRAPRRPR